MNPNNTFLIITLFVSLFNFQAHTKAQTDSYHNKYWVFFTDKNGVSFDPYTYFDEKAIERRVQQQIPLYDSTDFPLNETYVKSVMALTDSISKQSRWFNALVVYATDLQIEEVNKLPFVKETEAISSSCMPAYYTHEDDTTFSADASLLKNQLKNMNGNYFADNNFDGTGIRIAVFDAGFPSVDTHEAFEHLRKQNKILKTWDFVKNREYVYKYSSHGTSTLSCIAGIYKGQKIGLATGAEFLLVRTEMGLREPFSEEENWLAAAEWADKNGAHIISSSLGYTHHRYFPHNMDGKTSLVTRAANMAASKGILVVNAAGNEGSSSWKFMGAPADADSVLTIGGISPNSNIRISFSSYGPTADKRLKPNVMAFGRAFVAGKNGFTTADGTSFACPLVAGFAACAWQAKRELNNMQLFKEIEKSATLYPYFDYAHGYGVPQADYFTSVKKTLKPTFEFSVNGNILEIKTSKETIKEEDEKDDKLMFYNIQNPDGILHKYYVISVYSPIPVEIELNTLSKGQRVNVSYSGYYNSFLVE